MGVEELLARHFVEQFPDTAAQRRYDRRPEFAVLKHDGGQLLGCRLPGIAILQEVREHVGHYSVAGRRTEFFRHALPTV